MLDGKTLVYAAVGDSCSLFAVPGPKGEHAETKTVELLPEHSPTNLVRPPLDLASISPRSRLDLVDPVDRRDRAAHLDLPRQDEWASRLHKSGIHVVYDHPEMFDDPDNLLNVFEPDKSAPQLVESGACPV